MEAQQFSVRAMPAPGHDRRWCAQRPFTRETVTVTVKDNPKPHVREIDKATGKPSETGKILAYSYEITPAELEELRADPHIAVSVLGSGDADPLELNAAKAKIIELEAKLEKARKDHQAEIEELKAFRVGSMQQAEEAGKRASHLEQQLAAANVQLVEKGKKK